jgi:hypothetical protein
MCRLLTGSLISVRVSHYHHDCPNGRWGNAAEHTIKLTIVSEFRQQVEVIEPDRVPRWLLFHLPFLRPGQITVLSFGTVWRIDVAMT